MNPLDIPGINDWLATQGAPGRISVRQVVVEEDAFPRLAGLLAAQKAAERPVIVLMDHTPMRRRGGDAKARFLEAIGSVCRPEVIQLGTIDEPPHAELEIARELAGRLPPAALVLSFGSGTVTDLAKHARFLADREATGPQRRTFVSVPTACTVTAFSSALAVLGVTGVKRTITSQAPDAVWIDLNLLTDAPIDLTRAGVGDLLARGVAYADWYLSSLLGIDASYTDVPRMLLADHEAKLTEIAGAIARQGRRAFAALMEALLLAGYAMSVVGQTTPISGWEHVMSHYLDLWNVAQGRPLNLHGLQVAAGTFAATRAYEEFLRDATGEDLAAAARTDPASQAREQIEQHFAGINPTGAMREELLRDYLPKAQRWQAADERLRKLAAAWGTGEIQRELAGRLMPLGKMERIAEALDLPRSPEELESLPTPTAALDAVRYAHLVRQRFTLGDLLAAMGWLGEPRARRWLHGNKASAG